MCLNKLKRNKDKITNYNNRDFTDTEACQSREALSEHQRNTGTPVSCESCEVGPDA
ncbi:UNVERIFIED_CONTAM: hypothetical protein FKN15_021606 [Acipenser sinensis]